MELHILDTKPQMACGAAARAAEIIRAAIMQRGGANVVFPTGASQLEMLAELVAAPGIDWSCVTAFHLDEYIGMADSHPASFHRYLRERIIARLPGPLAEFHFIDGLHDAAAECRRLGEVLARCPIDLALIGIGENGHLAFNDPPADFTTDRAFLVVQLDEACRRQQFGEGWFPTLDAVPPTAITMSVPQIMRAAHLVCTVPDGRKARAAQAALEGPVTPQVPASILQRHPAVSIFLDPDSAALLRRS